MEMTYICIFLFLARSWLPPSVPAPSTSVCTHIHVCAHWMQMAQGRDYPLKIKILLKVKLFIFSINYLGFLKEFKSLNNIESFFIFKIFVLHSIWLPEMLLTAGLRLL